MPAAEACSLPGKLRASAERHRNLPAVQCGAARLAYGELLRQVDAFAAALQHQGVARGDRVGLYAVNADSFVAAYFGILAAGAVVVPINLLLNPREIAFILNDAGACGLVYHELFAPAVNALGADLPTVKFRVCIGARCAAPTDLSWAECLAAGGAPVPVPPAPQEDLAAILYTSGTTGRPKGAMLTHANLLANVHSIHQALRMAPGEEVVLVVLPMFHAFAATACMLAPLTAGCAIVPLPKFDPQLTARTIAAERATIFMGVPSMYSSLLHLPDEYTPLLKPLRLCVSGGAALPAEVMRRFEERFGIGIHEGDGPTECSPVTAVNPIGGRRKPASIGLPIPDVQMTIMDGQGRELPAGAVGEICVSGPNVMRGYWKLPDATREAFFGAWFRTGDLGSRDEEGYFYIVDRKKDMIIVNGMNVYPRMVEEVLYRFPPVREAAVVGEPHELHGEIPVAYLALKPGNLATEAAVRAFCREYLGRHEIPRRVYFVQELPKNAAGKILKRELRRQGEWERGIVPPQAPA